MTPLVIIIVVDLIGMTVPIIVITTLFGSEGTIITLILGEVLCLVVFLLRRPSALVESSP